VNAIVVGELSVDYATLEEVTQLLADEGIKCEDLSLEAAFLAGKCFLKYRRRGGLKRSPLPDFLIGAHAAVQGYRLLTRDVPRYRTYFPALQIISP
jgi:predicted nucleic acid-binding protein